MTPIEWRERMASHPNYFRKFAILLDGREIISHEFARRPSEAVENYAEGSIYDASRLSARLASGSKA